MPFFIPAETVTNRYMEDTGYCRSICRGTKQLIFPGFDAIEKPVPIIPDSVIQYCRYTDG